VLRAAKCMWRWNSVSWAIAVKSWGESCNMQSRKQTHQKFVFRFCKCLLRLIIDREINDIYLQEMWYLLSNMHRWFLSTITAAAHVPEPSQSYRQSLSPDFYIKKIWWLINFVLSWFQCHKDPEVICPRKHISYLQIISMAQSKRLD